MTNGRSAGVTPAGSACVSPPNGRLAQVSLLPATVEGLAVRQRGRSRASRRDASAPSRNVHRPCFISLLQCRTALPLGGGMAVTMAALLSVNVWLLHAEVRRTQ